MEVSEGSGEDGKESQVVGSYDMYIVSPRKTRIGSEFEQRTRLSYVFTWINMKYAEYQWLFCALCVTEIAISERFVWDIYKLMTS